MLQVLTRHGGAREVVLVRDFESAFQQLNGDALNWRALNFTSAKALFMASTLVEVRQAVRIQTTV